MLTEQSCSSQRTTPLLTYYAYNMYLMYYDDAAGNRVYTLKVSRAAASLGLQWQVCCSMDCIRTCKIIILFAFIFCRRNLGRTAHPTNPHTQHASPPTTSSHVNVSPPRRGSEFSLRSSQHTRCKALSEFFRRGVKGCVSASYQQHITITRGGRFSRPGGSQHATQLKLEFMLRRIPALGEESPCEMQTKTLLSL